MALFAMWPQSILFVLIWKIQNKFLNQSYINASREKYEILYTMTFDMVSLRIQLCYSNYESMEISPFFHDVKSFNSCSACDWYCNVCLCLRFSWNVGPCFQLEPTSNDLRANEIWYNVIKRGVWVTACACNSCIYLCISENIYEWNQNICMFNMIEKYVTG